MNQQSDLPAPNARDIAKAIVYQWEHHDKFRVVRGESQQEPNDVVIAKALLRVDREYGCEVMDSAGTIWQHAAHVEKERNQYRCDVNELRLLLLEVLEDDACAAGCNASYLDPKLRQRICEQTLRMEHIMKDWQQDVMEQQ
jgi:hypothetical protein